MLCQKGKVNWQLHGERNSKFFHSIMVKRRDFNSIKKLQVGENTFTEPACIKAALHSHFKERLTESNDDQVFSLGDLFSSKLSSDQRIHLEKEFSLEEIEEALKSTDKTKAPRPDGINAGLLALLWPEIKEDVMAFFNNFHSNGELPLESNSSFIALIPKTASTLHPSEFRPISLMNALLKLLTKIMANRLKPLMTYLVRQHQTTFIKGRQITDGILITSELVSLLQKQKTSGLIFKIDFEKAFDRVRWNFVFDTLFAMNFGPKWINWIRNLFESSHISVLVNEAPTEEFCPSRGLRQGDPLSPLTFNLVGEGLSTLLTLGAHFSIFRGASIKGAPSNISHLQFADDVILFINDDDASVMGIKRILQCFQILSGMKVNFSKSQIFCF